MAACHRDTSQRPPEVPLPASAPRKCPCQPAPPGSAPASQHPPGSAPVRRLEGRAHPGGWEPSGSLGSRPAVSRPPQEEPQCGLGRSVHCGPAGRRPEPVFVALRSSWGHGPAAEGRGPGSLRGLGLGETVRESRRGRPVPGQQASGRACTERRGHSRAWRGPPGVSQGGGGGRLGATPASRCRGPGDREASGRGNKRMPADGVPGVLRRCCCRPLPWSLQPPGR